MYSYRPGRSVLVAGLLALLATFVLPASGAAGQSGSETPDGERLESYPLILRRDLGPEGREKYGARYNWWYFRDEHTSGEHEEMLHFGPGRIPLSGDWTGDGEETPAWFDNGVWHFRAYRTGGPPDYKFRYGTKGDLPVAGDWLHDDDSEIDLIGVVRRTERGLTWYLETDTKDGHVWSDGKANIVFNYGSAGDLPVAGHWKRDVCAACPPGDYPAVIRSDRAGVLNWHLETDLEGSGGRRAPASDGKANVVLRYGRVTDVPVHGDWNGDGLDTLGVVRGNHWLLDQESTLGDDSRRRTASDGRHDIAFRYGLASDRYFMTFKGELPEAVPSNG